MRLRRETPRNWVVIRYDIQSFCLTTTTANVWFRSLVRFQLSATRVSSLFSESMWSLKKVTLS